MLKNRFSVLNYPDFQVVNRDHYTPNPNPVQAPTSFFFPHFEVCFCLDSPFHKHDFRAVSDSCTIEDQFVAASAQFLCHSSRKGINTVSMFQGKVCSDQGTALFLGFYHKNSIGKSADDPVSCRKSPVHRRRARGSSLMIPPPFSRIR